MTAEQQGSDESGEGLSEALRKAARDHIGLTEGEFWPSSIADAQAAVVERILADRLAAVRAERDGWREAAGRSARRWNDAIIRLADAEAALATARREADELRGRLVAVERDVGMQGYRFCSRECHGEALSIVRAALANPSAAQGEGEVPR